MYSSIQEVISLTEVQVVSDLPLFLIMYFNLKYLPMWLICLCGVISHVLLSFAFFRDPLKCFRNSPTYLVANLAASHFIICLFGPFVVVSIHWSLNIIWKCTTAASIVTICSIAADRYLMVAFPFKHHSLMRGKKIILWIIFIWVLSSSSSFEILLDPQSSVLVIHSINLYIALIIMFGAGLLYVLTFLSLRKQARNLGLHNPAGESNANSTQRVRQLREKRFLNTIVLVACIEVIDRYCSLFNLVRTSCGKRYLFSAINPNRYTLVFLIHIILLYACHKSLPVRHTFTKLSQDVLCTLLEMRIASLMCTDLWQCKNEQQ